MPSFPVVLAAVATLVACGGNHSGRSASHDKPTASQSRSMPKSRALATAVVDAL